jgi:hypothetical protein
LTPSDPHRFLKGTVEQVFIQQIYSAVIRSLVAFGREKDDFVLGYDEVEFLARTFYREKLGTHEAAWVCLGPAWSHKDRPHLGEHKKAMEEGNRKYYSCLRCTMVE